MKVFAFFVVFMLGGIGFVGGQVPIGYNGVQFQEKEMRQFGISVEHKKFARLLNQVDTNIVDVAGFIFVPIWEKGGIKKDSTFITIGFGVALAYWGDYNPNISVLYNRAIEINGFAGIPDAVSYFRDFKLGDTPKTEVFLLTKEYYTNEPGLFKTAVDTSSAMYKTAREFDLGFMSYPKYKDFALSKRFYEENKREKFGIYFDRSIVAIDSTSNIVEEDGKNFKNHRTLVFRPYPIPPLSDTDAASSVAYSVSPVCPPHWRDALSVSSESYANWIKANSSPVPTKSKSNLSTLLFLLGGLLFFAILSFVFYRKAKKLSENGIR